MRLILLFSLLYSVLLQSDTISFTLETSFDWEMGASIRGCSADLSNARSFSPPYFREYTNSCPKQSLLPRNNGIEENKYLLKLYTDEQLEVILVDCEGAGVDRYDNPISRSFLKKPNIKTCIFECNPDFKTDLECQEETGNTKAYWSTGPCDCIEPCDINTSGSAFIQNYDSGECALASWDSHWTDIGYTDMICGCPDPVDGSQSLYGNPPICEMGEIWYEDGCYSDHDGDGTPDKCDRDYEYYDLLDCDGDGLNNLDEDDPLSSCDGPESSTRIDYPSDPSYSFNVYVWYGITSSSNCKMKINDPNIDYIIYGVDADDTCEDEYCWIHKLTEDCSFDADRYSPGANWKYISNVSESECFGMKDMIIYDGHSYEPPDYTNCPNTYFCFLHYMNGDDDNDDNLTSPDLNSTNEDLKPLLESQNQTNEHLQHIEDKQDIANESLNDLLTTNKQSNEYLDKLTLDSKQSLSNQYEANSKLDSINNHVRSSKNSLSNLESIALRSDSKLNDITNNTAQILEALKSTDKDITDPFEDIDFEDEGQESIDDEDMENDIKNSMELTYHVNLFNLSSLGSSGLSRVSFTFYGTRITVFEPSMLNGFPMVEIRNLMLFFFAIAGFITVFRTI